MTRGLQKQPCPSPRSDGAGLRGFVSVLQTWWNVWREWNCYFVAGLQALGSRQPLKPAAAAGGPAGSTPASPAQRAEPQPGRSPCPPETIRGGDRMQSEGSEVGLSLGLASFLKVAGFSHSSRCPGAPVLSLCCWCWRHSDFLLVLRSPTLLPLSPFGPAYKPGHCFLSPFFLTTSSQQNPTAINTYP